MLVHLAEHLDIPLRERNVLLTAGGFAPLYSETDLEAPEMSAVHRAIQRLLASHEPYPAVVVDRWWNLVAGNASIALLVEGVDEGLLQPPVNVLRASLHPRGLAPRIRNLGEWRAHLLTRLRGQVDKTGAPSSRRCWTNSTATADQSPRWPGPTGTTGWSCLCGCAARAGI
jgi:hypothetical protein